MHIFMAGVCVVLSCVVACKRAALNIEFSPETSAQRLYCQLFVIVGVIAVAVKLATRASPEFKHTQP
jgi:hypothetical protein